MNENRITIVFAYGSLADPERQMILCGRTFPMKDGRLPGHRLSEPPGCYRMIYPDPASQLRGKLVMDVDAEALEAFDRWEDEGNLYRRVAVLAEDSSGNPVTAWAYYGMGKDVPKPGG
jgi:gamma-glutamylcyclotransferase (GGCT)/AIG2-like uncharacterized protein YtfP